MQRDNHLSSKIFNASIPNEMYEIHALKQNLLSVIAISSTQVSDSHLSPPGALQSRRASLQ